MLEMSIFKYFQKVGETSAGTASRTEEDDPESPVKLTDSSDSSSIPEPGSESEPTDDGGDDDSPPVVSKLGASPDDVAAYIGSSTSISDAGKYQLLVGHFKPGPNYNFPKGAYGRSFQHRWLQQFPWLAYSKQENGGFSLPCVLFATSGYHQSALGILVQRPLTSFSKALELLRKHAASSHHQTAVTRADEFLKVMRNHQPDIRRQISQTIASQVSTNREILSSIIKVVILCGRQNLALRGHRDTTDMENNDQFPANYGNFWALLNFRVDSGDSVLRDHLATAAQNATYTSYNIQNQLIDILGNQIRDKILNRVKEAGWFTVVADEVTDLSNEEILSIVLRYVDPNSALVREDFVSFLECDTGITGHCLADKIMGCLQMFGLDLLKLRGQSYDGAGNMAGPVNGTAAVISAKYPLALYMHCASHCLNLAVVKSLQVTSIRNMMGVVNKVYTFFDAHPKRQRALDRAIEENQPESVISKLKDLCRTRWV